MKKQNIIIVLLVILAVLIVISSKNKEAFVEAEITAGVDSSAVAVAEESLPKLLELGSLTCVPCKMMAPILEDLKNTYAGQLNIEFIDTVKNKDAGTKYSIRVIPTQIFLDATGDELFRHEGFFSKEDILAKWKELGSEFLIKE